MAFFKRVLDHLFNQVLVDSLANSRWFQRFAVWSHGAMKELSEKGKAGTFDAQVSQYTKSASEASSKFRKEFFEELRKIQSKQQDAGSSSIKKT